jgi:hypothetical protein
VTSENVGIDHDIHPFILMNLSSVTEHCTAFIGFIAKGLWKYKR